MKKYIIQPLIIAVIALLSYQVNVLNNETSKVINRDTNTKQYDADTIIDKTEAVKDYGYIDESFYSEPLDVYYYALKDINNNHLYLWSASWFIYSIKSNVKYDKERILSKIGYSLIDLNEDGIEELIIADITQKSNLNQKIYLVCTIINNSPYVVMDENGASDSLIYDGGRKGKIINDAKIVSFLQENDAKKLKPFREYIPNMPEDYYVDANYILLGKEYSSWQKAYLDYLYRLKSYSPDSYTFSLIYVDDNEIPELVVDSGVQATGCYILSYFNGMATAICTDRVYFSYIERGGMICNSDGHPGYYYDHVFKLNDARWTGAFIGDKYRKEDAATDTDDYDDLSYFIDLEEVNEHEYMDKLNEIYDVSESKEPEVYVSIDEIIEILERYNF